MSRDVKNLIQLSLLLAFILVFMTIPALKKQAREARERSAQNRFVANNETEKFVDKFTKKQISKADFFEALFNSECYILHSPDQLNSETGVFVDNPTLFSMFDKNNNPYLVFFTDSTRATPAIKKYPTFSQYSPIIVGDLLMSLPVETGVSVNPYWDKYFMWNREEINDIKKHMTRFNDKWLYL